jgi:hypothetical protein
VGYIVLCDPVVSSNLLAGINQRSSLHSDENLNIHVINRINRSKNTDSHLQLEETSFDEEFSMEEAQKEDKETATMKIFHALYL